MSERRLLLAVDAQGYGASAELFQQEIQRGMKKVLDGAAAASGLRRETWMRQESGDGELSVLPLGEPEKVLVDRFVRELNAELNEHNRVLAAKARVRMRVAVHFGPAGAGALGFTGAGPVVVKRLCDCAAARAALDQTDATLVVALSRTIYEDTVAGLLVSLDPAKLRRVRVKEKEFEDDAWLWLPGRDVHALRLDGPEDDPPRAAEPVPDPPDDTGGGVHHEYFTNATIHGNVAGRDLHIHGGSA